MTFLRWSRCYWSNRLLSPSILVHHFVIPLLIGFLWVFKLYFMLQKRFQPLFAMDVFNFRLASCMPFYNFAILAPTPLHTISEGMECLAWQYQRPQSLRGITTFGSMITLCLYLATQTLYNHFKQIEIVCFQFYTFWDTKAVRALMASPSCALKNSVALFFGISNCSTCNPKIVSIMSLDVVP